MPNDYAKFAHGRGCQPAVASKPRVDAVPGIEDGPEKAATGGIPLQNTMNSGGSAFAGTS